MLWALTGDKWSCPNNVFSGNFAQLWESNCHENSTTVASAPLTGTLRNMLAACSLPFGSPDKGVHLQGGQDNFYVAWVFALELKLSKTLSGLVYSVPYLYGGRSPPP